MKSVKPYLSVVIPCYNEERNIKVNILSHVANFLKIQQYSFEVIIVDDGSTDQSAKLLEEFVEHQSHWRVIKNPHRGKGNTVVTGILKTMGEIVLFTDFDQATPITEVNKLLPYFEKGFDVIIGSRNSQRHGAPLFRLLMARGFMILRTLVLGLAGIHDTQCGFKAFKKDAAVNIFKRLKVYGDKNKEVKGSHVTAGFDVESLFLAKKLGYKIKEVPVEWRYVETRRVNPLIDSWNGFWDIVKIRLNSLKGEYDEQKN